MLGRVFAQLRILTIVDCALCCVGVVERIFSLLKNSFNEQHYSRLEDYTEASITNC